MTRLTFPRALLLTCCGVMIEFWGCDGPQHHDAVEQLAFAVGLMAGVVGAVLMFIAVIRYAVKK